MEVQIEVQMGKQEEVQMEVEIEIGPYCWNDKKTCKRGLATVVVNGLEQVDLG